MKSAGKIKIIREEFNQKMGFWQSSAQGQWNFLGNLHHKANEILLGNLHQKANEILWIFRRQASAHGYYHFCRICDESQLAKSMSIFFFFSFFFSLLQVTGNGDQGKANSVKISFIGSGEWTPKIIHWNGGWVFYFPKNIIKTTPLPTLLHLAHWINLNFRINIIKFRSLNKDINK